MRFTARFTSRVATAISSPATANVASASSSTSPTAPKSMPCPGVKSVLRSMSATLPSPRSRMAARTCSFVAPEGMSRPTMPAKTRSVARPRIFGPTTLRPTLTTTHASRVNSVARSGRNWATSRLPDPLKSIERWSGLPRPSCDPQARPSGSLRFRQLESTISR
ncbi:hypothetical protein STENM223S_03368 [Streptomyces tendae]